MSTTRQEGVVLTTALFLLTVLSVFLLSLSRASHWALIEARHQQAIERAFAASAVAISAATDASRFPRETTRSESSPSPGTRVTLTLSYLGESVEIPHQAYDAVRDAHLRAHHFRVTAQATHDAALWTSEHDFALVADAGIPHAVPLDRTGGAGTVPLSGALIPGPWRGW